jgi:N-acetylglutamate synthase-like GNAT family acetyltransferase
VKYAEEQAKAAGFNRLLALSTQAVNYFVHKCGFQLGDPDDLPKARRETYDRSGRRSQVLRKSL